MSPVESTRLELKDKRISQVRGSKGHSLVPRHSKNQRELPLIFRAPGNEATRDIEPADKQCCIHVNSVHLIMTTNNNNKINGKIPHKEHSYL